MNELIHNSFLNLDSEETKRQIGRQLKDSFEYLCKIVGFEEAMQRIYEVNHITVKELYENY